MVIKSWTAERISHEHFIPESKMNLQKQVQPTLHYVLVVIKLCLWQCDTWLKLFWKEENYILSGFPWKGVEAPLNECPRSLTIIVSFEIYVSSHTSNALAVNRIPDRKNETHKGFSFHYGLINMEIILVLNTLFIY